MGQDRTFWISVAALGAAFFFGSMMLPAVPAFLPHARLTVPIVPALFTIGLVALVVSVLNLLVPAWGVARWIVMSARAHPRWTKAAVIVAGLAWPITALVSFQPFELEVFYGRGLAEWGTAAYWNADGESMLHVHKHLRDGEGLCTWQETSTLYNMNDVIDVHPPEVFEEVLRANRDSLIVQTAVVELAKTTARIDKMLLVNNEDTPLTNIGLLLSTATGQVAEEITVHGVPEGEYRVSSPERIDVLGGRSVTIDRLEANGAAVVSAVYRNPEGFSAFVPVDPNRPFPTGRRLVRATSQRGKVNARFHDDVLLLDPLSVQAELSFGTFGTNPRALHALIEDELKRGPAIELREGADTVGFRTVRASSDNTDWRCYFGGPFLVFPDRVVQWEEGPR